MLFNSVEFLLFFLVVHLVFWTIPGFFRKHWLVAASIFFYGYWSLPFLVHFLAVVLVSYALIQWMIARKSRFAFVLAIVLNVGNLFLFKYTNSFLQYASDWFGWSGALVWKESLGIFLPLAISFYTFQIIAFLVDVWRGEIKEASLLRFSVFILFFPQLIAGPIMRHRDFYYQMDHPEFSEQKTWDGLYLIIQGIIKKVFIADGVASIINPVWANPGAYDSVAIWAAVLGFSAQVYADFSGYTDMARGLAKMLGYEIPENFTAPYFSTTFAELWRRWHITLATWLRDYLYIPLGGSRAGAFRTNANLIIVMSLGGLWHGDTYNFFLWGFLHGVFLVVERLLGLSRPSERWAFRWAQWLVVISGWVAGSIFFRAADLSTVGMVFQGMFSSASGMGLEHMDRVYQFLLLAMGFQFLRLRGSIFQKIPAGSHKWLVAALAIILFYAIVRIDRPSEEFIYFQF